MTTESHTLASSAVAPDDAGADTRAAPRRATWTETWAALLALASVMATVGLLIGRGAIAGLFVEMLCLGVLLLAASFDSATGRIPNPLTYTACLAGLAINSLAAPLNRFAPAVEAHWLGAPGPMQSLLGFALFGGIGIGCMLLAGMGGGDMKLLAAVGALLGISRAADVIVCTLAVAVVYALVNLVLAGRLNSALRGAALQALNAVYLRNPAPMIPHRTRTFPLAIPVLLGMLISAVPAVAALLARLLGAGS